jgi:transcriptional regulator GlxA family with amidase domain
MNSRDNKYLSEKDRVFLQKFYSLIEGNYRNKDFSTADLANRLFMSQRQLLRKSHLLIGCTAKQYLRTYRLRKAKELIMDGKCFSLVADVTGFASQSYFSKCFRAQFETSAREYRYTNILHH